MRPEGLWEAGASEDRIRAICGGVTFQFEGAPLMYRVPDYPEYAKGAPEVISEAEKLREKEKARLYEESVPMELGVCPSNVAVKPGEVRLVHDWSHPACGLNQVLGKKEAQYGAADGTLGNVKGGSRIGGIDSADCFHHWAVSQAARRLLGIRWPGGSGVGAF